MKAVAPPPVVRLNFHPMLGAGSMELDSHGNKVRVLDQRMAVAVVAEDGTGIKVGSIAEIGQWFEQLGYRWIAGTNGMWTTAPHPRSSH